MTREVPPLPWGEAAGQHAVFITATEFAQAGLELPLLFVATGEHDLRHRPRMSTAALLGLEPGENLQIDGDRWVGRYIPAAIRCQRLTGAGAADGEAAAEFVARFEREAERTEAFCERVVGLDVLKAMKAEATLPNGQTIAIDGFHTIDEDRMHALPDATVVELHRTGQLMLMQMHLASLANIRHLVHRKAERLVARPH